MNVIAENVGDLRDFGPYVPAIDDSGRVSFFASLADGSHGIFRGTGEGEPELLFGACEITSHPDMNEAGRLTFYGKLKSGQSALFLDGTWVTEDFACIGPLGPTMNESGAVAFRGERTLGKPGIFLLHEGRTETLAEAGDEFSAFHGLPVVNNANEVAFRADLTSGSQAIYLWRSGQRHLVADTSGEFKTIGLFPSLNHAGSVAFAATKADGWSGIVIVDGKGARREMSATGWNFRGALINSAGHEVIFATPRGGDLGIYTSELVRLFGVGDACLHSAVSELAQLRVHQRNRPNRHAG